MTSYLHITNDASGESRMADRAWSLQGGDFTPPSPTGYLISETMNASGVLVMHHPPEYRDAWHTAPTRVLVLVLDGCASIHTSDGDERTVRPGDRILVEDTAGRGHLMEGVDGQAYTLALVLLEPVPVTGAGT